MSLVTIILTLYISLFNKKVNTILCLVQFLGQIYADNKKQQNYNPAAFEISLPNHQFIRLFKIFSRYW
jgi:hypothetical protein